MKLFQVFIAKCFPAQYFDVDTVDIVNRIQSAGWPFGAKPFLDVAAGNPDLYGPFWLCTTLVFIIGVTSNILSWLNITDDRVSVRLRNRLSSVIVTVVNKFYVVSYFDRLPCSLTSTTCP